MDERGKGSEKGWEEGEEGKGEGSMELRVKTLHQDHL